MSPEATADLCMTIHARARVQSRSIPSDVIEMLLDFGAEVAAPGNAIRLFFDKGARNRVKKLMGGDRGVRTIERWFNTCAILGNDGRIITVYRK